MKLPFFFDAFNRWRTYRSTMTQLERLSDLELHDIGLMRSEIPSVARRTSHW
ncbi:MAG: DUF1127 domain-containing protein [Hyphomicrobiales bacterium]